VVAPLSRRARGLRGAETIEERAQLCANCYGDNGILSLSAVARLQECLLAPNFHATSEFGTNG